MPHRPLSRSRPIAPRVAATENGPTNEVGAARALVAANAPSATFARTRRFALTIATLAVGLAPAALHAAAPLATDAANHPVWGPALVAEAAAVTTAAPARAEADREVARSAVGVSGWAQVRPAVTWRSTAPDGSPSVVLSAGVRWRDDPVLHIGAQLDRHRGDVAAHERALRAVRQVTNAYLDLRRAHVALELAAARVPDRHATYLRAEAAARAGSSAPSQLGVAALELERAHAAVDRAARDLTAAERDAARHGIDVRSAADQHHALLQPEPLEGWRLPPPPRDLPHEDLVRRTLERDLAAARLERRSGWAVLDDVRFDGTWNASGTRVRAGIGIDEGRPGAWADVAWTGRAAENWTIGLSARLRIDDGWHDDLVRAERILADAEAALAATVAEAEWVAAEARRTFEEAEQDVVYAERALALGRAALRELSAELAAARGEWRAALSAGDAVAAADADARATRFEAAYRRAELGHQRERDAFLRAWERYLRAAERLSAGVGWPFAVAPEGHVAE